MIKQIILFVFLLSGVSALPLASDGGGYDRDCDY